MKGSEAQTIVQRDQKYNQATFVCLFGGLFVCVFVCLSGCLFVCFSVINVGLLQMQ